MLHFKEHCGCEDADPVLEMGVSIDEQVNDLLFRELSQPLLSPESGFLRVKKILAEYQIDMPEFYDLEQEGDELVIDLSEAQSLYILYSLTDNGYYEFYAEVGNPDRIKELLESGEGDSEED